MNTLAPQYGSGIFLQPAHWCERSHLCVCPRAVNGVVFTGVRRALGAVNDGACVGPRGLTAHYFATLPMCVTPLCVSIPCVCVANYSEPILLNIPGGMPATTFDDLDHDVRTKILQWRRDLTKQLHYDAATVFQRYS